MIVINNLIFNVTSSRVLRHPGSLRAGSLLPRPRQMGAMKDMALHPVCFRKGRQSQNDPDIQIGKDMIIHPDFMTSSQPVSFCALKV